MGNYFRRSMERQENMELEEKKKEKEIECFIPEADNPYPLCVGRNLEKCKDCQIRADWEPEDPYGIGA